MSSRPPTNRYAQIIERIFQRHHNAGVQTFEFARDEIVSVAEELGIAVPKNIGDLIYSFRYRVPLPASISALAEPGHAWVIEPVGRSRYRFAVRPEVVIEPNPNLSETKVPDSTPGMIDRYALSDEQALLAKLRYNRLVDIFTGVTCYSLQSHLRTSLPGLGQIETDEIYVGVDRRGAHYVFPIQAKGGRDRLGVVQTLQDFAMCEVKFQALICKPISAQFMAGDLIALFEFEQSEAQITVAREKHYRLVPSDDLDASDLLAYRSRSSD